MAAPLRDLKRSELLIFLKAPVPGRVKTRLAAGIGDAAAARVHVAMARETRDRAAALGGVEIVWVYEPAPGFPDLGWLGRVPGRVRRQAAGGLGRRLELAFATALQRGSRACAIGVDSPDLPAERVAEAFRVLDSADAVVVPSDDGGYCLIGLSGPAPALFRGVPWSSPEVLAATRAKARAVGLRLKELPGHYDVDGSEGLLRWLKA